jgi:hypothetical protein
VNAPRLGRYILVNREPVEEPDLLTWATWLETADLHVRLSEQGDVRVSTVFMGLDHNYWGEGPPILFETMAFVGDQTVGQERYATWAEAEEGHARWVDQVFKPTPILSLPVKT